MPPLRIAGRVDAGRREIGGRIQNFHIPSAAREGDALAASLVIYAFLFAPPAVSLPVGSTQQLTAIVYDVLGNVVPSQSIDWHTSNAGVATISGGGLVTGTGAGSANITATIGSITSNALAFTVTAVVADTVPASIAIPAVMLISSGTRQLTATVLNAEGATLAVSPTGWASSSPAVATVNSSGLVTMVAAGTTTITATLGGITSNGCVTSVPAQSVGAPTFPRTLLTTTRASTPSAGSTHVVASGGDLQAALDAAVPGDIITIATNGTISGNYQFQPTKTSTGATRGAGIAGGWITVKPSASVPAEGTRIGANGAISHTLPIVKTLNSSPVLRITGAGAARIRFIGIEFTAALSVTSCNTLIECGAGDETSAAAIPTNVIFDCCYVHGHSTLEARRGISLNAESMALVDSSFTEWHSTGFDTQAAWGWNSPGRLKFVNCHFQGSTECWGFGGVDPHVVGQVPEDIECRKCYFERPLAWKGGPWLIKNTVELKLGKYGLIEDCVLENCWPNGQLGWGFVLWSVNQQNTAYWSETGHWTIRRIKIINHAAGFQMVDGYVDVGTGPFIGLHDVAVSDITFVGLASTLVDDGGYGLLFGRALPRITFERVTGFKAAHTPLWEFAVGAAPSDFVIKNCLTGSGGNQISMQGPFSSIASGASAFTHTAVAQFDNYAGYLPADNFFPLTLDAIKLVGGATAAVADDAVLSDLALASDSPYKNAGTDGADIGCDIGALTTGVTGVADAS